MYKILSHCVRVLFTIFMVLGINTKTFAQNGVDITVHYVEGIPQSGKYAYDVSVYFSAFQAGGDPITDLQTGDITITEDGKQVDITDLELTKDDPISVIVVMDTSGSMKGVKMDAARQAAAQFISGLGKKDRAAVMSFNSTVKTEIGFTDDLGDAREEIELLNAVDGAGTCFYDALNEAITLSATLPTGRRAIVILTDGVDELPNGNKCSKYKEDEIITTAKSGTTRVPIYTIGLGDKVDATGLSRIAEQTGGRYQFAGDEQKLQILFRALLEQLRSQYRATYISTSAPGPHQLVVEVSISGQQVRELREFVLPSFPYSVSFTSPGDNETVKEAVNIKVEIIGQGDPIKQVEFFINEKSIGVVEQAPYELEWEPTTEDNGEIVIDAVIQGENGQELARGTISSSVDMTVPSPETPIATQESASTPGVSGSGISSTTLVYIGIIGAIVMIAIIVVVILAARKKNQDKEREKEWQEKVNTDFAPTSSFAYGGESLTMDGIAPDENSLGALFVLQSDDPSLVNQRFDITKMTTSIGRKADNDIIFPKDTPVSRHHATIESIGGKLYISEVMSQDDNAGAIKNPVYGTFVNETQIEGQVLLKHGDLIRLGKRVKLKFIGSETESGDTLDQVSGEERTMDLSDFDDRTQ